MVIFLVGFMGAGKSVVALELARVLGCEYADLDSVVEVRAQMSIPDIFARLGEDVFRNLESQALKSLALMNHGVVATGGGVVMRDENVLSMKRSGKIVFLKASWDTLRQRVGSGCGRPLAKDKAAMKKLLELRTPKYENADLVVDTDMMSPSQVADKIIRELKLQ